MPAKRIVIFGDSLSDLGNMKDRKIGAFADMNDLGRFSDGKNWVDFLWAYVTNGGDLYTTDASKYHRCLNDAHRLGSGMELVCYAEGGSLATGDVKGITKWGKRRTAGLLSNLETQVGKYYAERGDTCFSEDDEPLLGASGAVARVKNKDTLHIIWLGGNDVCTVNRDPDVMPEIADAVMLQAVDLTLKVPGSRVVVFDLPDPQYMPRFKDDGPLQKQYNKAADAYNDKLAWYGRAMKNVSLFKISTVMTPSYLGLKGFAPFHAQKDKKSGKTISSKDVLSASLLQHQDIALDESSEFGTVSDQLHPTEGVYKVIAEEVIAYLKDQKLIA